MISRSLAALVLCLWSAIALAQTSPGFPVGPLNANVLNQAFSRKADYPGIFATPQNWTAPQNFLSGFTGNSPLTSNAVGNAPYNLTVPNPLNGYSTINNAMQVSLGAPILATGQFGSNAVGIQQALVATVSIQAADPAGNAGFALAGYGITSSTVTGAVGVGGFAMCGAPGCNEIDGANQVVANAPTLQSGVGFDFTLMLGNQVNINLRQKAGSVNPSGPLYGYYVVGGGNATNNTGWAYAADQLSIITGAKWSNAFISYNGAAVNAVSVGTVSGTQGAPPANSASQPIVFNSYLASVNKQTTLSTDNPGNLLLASPSGFSFSVNGVSELDFGTVNGANWTFGNAANVFIPGILLASANVAATTTANGALRLTGGLGVTGAGYFGGEVVVGITNVAGLPACNAAHKSARYFVTDQATATAYLGAVTGSGATQQAVTCDGTNWKQG